MNKKFPKLQDNPPDERKRKKFKAAKDLKELRIVCQKLVDLYLLLKGN